MYIFIYCVLVLCSFSARAMDTPFDGIEDCVNDPAWQNALQTSIQPGAYSGEGDSSTNDDDDNLRADEELDEKDTYKSEESLQPPPLKPQQVASDQESGESTESDSDAESDFDHRAPRPGIRAYP